MPRNGGFGSFATPPPGRDRHLSCPPVQSLCFGACPASAPDPSPSCRSAPWPSACPPQMQSQRSQTSCGRKRKTGFNEHCSSWPMRTVSWCKEDISTSLPTHLDRLTYLELPNRISAISRSFLEKNFLRAVLISTKSLLGFKFPTNSENPDKRETTCCCLTHF